MRKGAELLLIKAMIRHDNTVCENTRIQTGLSDFLFYSKSCFTFKSKPKSYVESAEHPTSSLLESLCDQTCSRRPDVNLLCHSRDFFPTCRWCKRWVYLLWRHLTSCLEAWRWAFLPSPSWCQENRCEKRGVSNCETTELSVSTQQESVSRGHKAVFRHFFLFKGSFAFPLLPRAISPDCWCIFCFIVGCLCYNSKRFDRAVAVIWCYINQILFYRSRTVSATTAIAICWPIDGTQV